MIQTPQLSISKRGLFSSLGILASALLFSGCQDEDYGYTSEQIAYRTNFEKMYGKVAEDQTWDFSSYNLRKLGLAGGPSSATRSERPLTRAEISGLVTKYDANWYTVTAKTTTWLNTHLKEKDNNTEYVSSFDWEKSSVGDADPLYIIPIYQGQTGMIWNLELIDIDESTSTIIWSKSENLQYTQKIDEWDEFFYVSYNNDQAPYRSDKLGSVKFQEPLAKLPADYTSDNDIIAAFTISEDLPNIAGSFYITFDRDNKKTRVEITSDNCSDFFAEAKDPNIHDNTGMFKTINGTKMFNFKKDGNFELNPDRYLNNLTPNKVYLNLLLGKTIRYNDIDYTITVDDLKTLEFVIDDSTYPKDNSNNPNNYYTFNTWSPERIRVFVKYYGSGTQVIQLKDGADQYTEHHTINKYNVQTRPIKIDINQLRGTHFALNLKTMSRGDGDKDLSNLGDDHRSDQGFMSQINHFSETGSPIDTDDLASQLSNFEIDLGDSFEYMVIGCEDAGYKGMNSDQDYNDVVLLLVGKTLPNQSIKKRYMIEDLGSYLDFDFNDIVVDVTEKVTRTNAGKTYTQTAAIRHLRGTIPFRISIGEKMFGKGEYEGKIMRGHNNGDDEDYDPSKNEASFGTGEVKDQYIWEYETVIRNDADLTNLRTQYWNPDKNNIKVEVWPSKFSENGNNNDVYWTGEGSGEANNLGENDVNNVQLRKIVEFPKPGTVPYIIATDQTVGWMEEGVSIPDTWIQLNEDASYPLGNFNNGFPQHKEEETDDSGSGVTTDKKGNKITNPTSITDGNITLYSTTTAVSEDHSIYIANTVFNDIYTGDLIIVHVDENLYDGSRLGFKNPNDGKPISGSVGTNGEIVVTGDYIINVNSQDMLNSLQTNGLLIDGQYVTVDRITVSSTGGGNIVANSNDIAESAFKLSTQRTVVRSYSNSVPLNNSDLQKLYVGDKIVVHVDNLRENSYLGFKKNTSGWPNFDYQEGLGSTANGNVNVTGDIVLEVNANNIADIKNGSGLVINGQYVTITGVDVQNSINKQSSETEGSITLDNETHLITGFSNGFTIPASKFKNLYFDDEIIFHVSNLRNDSKLGVHAASDPQQLVGFGNEWGNIDNVTKDWTLKITAENYELITQYGLYVNGVNITVDAVTVRPAAGASLITNQNSVTSGENIYTTRTVCNNWYRFDLAKNNFSNLKVGDKIVVHVDNLRGNAKSCNSGVGMHIISPWGNVPGYSSNGDNRYNITGDVVLDITNENISLIKDGGLAIQGSFVTVTGVSIIDGSVTLMNQNATFKQGKTYEELRNNGALYQTLLDNIDNYSSLTVYFNQTEGGTINFFTPRKTTNDWEWNSLQNGIATNDKTSYTFDLTTDDRKDKITKLSGLLIQYYWDGQEDASITITKIVLHN